MFGIDDALLGAGMNFVGGMINNAFAGSRQEDAQKFNAEQAEANRSFQSSQVWEQREHEKRVLDNTQAYATSEAQKQRDWTEQMSSTAYQRTMADMKAAGLNPMLAYLNKASPVGGGSAASTPSAPSSGPAHGSQATSAPGAPVFDVLAPAVSSAIAIKNLQNNTNLADAEVKLKDQLARTDAVRAGAVAVKAGLDEAGTRKLLAEMPASEAIGSKGKAHKEHYDSEIGRLLEKTGLAGGQTAKTIEPITDVFSRRWGTFR